MTAYTSAQEGAEPFVLPNDITNGEQHAARFGGLILPDGYFCVIKGPTFAHVPDLPLCNVFCLRDTRHGVAFVMHTVNFPQFSVGPNSDFFLRMAYYIPGDNELNPRLDSDAAALAKAVSKPIPSEHTAIDAIRLGLVAMEKAHNPLHGLGEPAALRPAVSIFNDDRTNLITRVGYLQVLQAAQALNVIDLETVLASTGSRTSGLQIIHKAYGVIIFPGGGIEVRPGPESHAYSWHDERRPRPQ